MESKYGINYVNILRNHGKEKKKKKLLNIIHKTYSIYDQTYKYDN